MNEVGEKLSNTSQIYVQPAAKDDDFDDTPLAKAFTATDIAHAGFMLSLFLEWTQFQWNRRMVRLRQVLTPQNCRWEKWKIHYFIFKISQRFINTSYEDNLPYRVSVSKD